MSNQDQRAMGNNMFVAHHRKSDGKTQSLEEHLYGVAEISKLIASKIGLGAQGEAIGLLHDFGKYSSAFQNYIKSAVGLVNPDEDDFVDAHGLRGKIDHSSAGAQYIWQALQSRGSGEKMVAQILALCVASHHSGLIDCLTSKGKDNFSRRMAKPEEKSHLQEVEYSANREIISAAKRILESNDITAILIKAIKEIHQYSGNKTIFYFQIGLLVRYIFSCLIDADRLNTADFEYPKQAKYRQSGKYIGWEPLINRLDHKLNSFTAEKEIDQIRADVSNSCLDKSARPKGLFTLTVPTGGGKTLASLRFALHHAKKHEIERIYYVIPYTSIIDQNAGEVRKILEGSEPEERGSVVLEYHSNLVFEENKTQWREKLLAENWDAPIIFTTSVQFLECLFSGGTRNARRMHQLANSIIIFDEIQTLPIRTVHMFNNAINFLTETCGSSVVLCTATQPLLGAVSKEKGCLSIGQSNELVENTEKLFSDLKRVKIINRIKYSGEWSDEEIATLANNAIEYSSSCLIIVNTKPKAKSIFQQCEKSVSIDNHYHLSTSMCAAHRSNIFAIIKEKLTNKEPVLCVSTQLIEAGVDIDFGSVIRSVAGLDSIAQAAGRCNRNKENDIGIVYIVNPESEKIGLLPDIATGKAVTERVFRELADDKDSLDGDLLHPEVMKRYFQYYFYERKEYMSYNVGGRDVPEDTLLNMLAENTGACGEYRRENNEAYPAIPLRQSFMEANKKFEVIGAGTQGIVVPYGKEGKDIIGKLCGAFDVEKDYKLLKQAQRYTVNVYPHIMKKLCSDGAIDEAQENSGIYCLKKEHYSESFGLSEYIVDKMDLLHC